VESRPIHLRRRHRRRRKGSSSVDGGDGDDAKGIIPLVLATAAEAAV